MGNVSSKSITNILMPVKEKNNWKQQRHPIIDDFSRSCVGCHVETTTITHWVSDWWPLTVAKLESSWWQTNSCSPCPDNIPPLCHKQQNVTISQGQTHNQNLYFLEAYTRYVIYMSHTQKESWRLINPTNTKKTKVWNLWLWWQNSPGNDDETVESIPRFGQVSAFTINSHGDHFDGHFNGEKGKYEIVQHLSFIQNRN